MALTPARLQWSDDGTLLNLEYGDIYFQRGQGLEESRYVFLEKNNLPARFRALGAGAFHIAELGFGSGLNFLLTAELFRKEAPPGARLVYASVEKHPVPREDLQKIYVHFGLPDSAALLEQYPPFVEGFHALDFVDGRVRLLLMFGDVADQLPQLRGKFDAWYLDGFSPAKNPAMWEEKLFPLIAARTAPGGTLATFSSAGPVRRGLEAAGFAVEKTTGFGVKRDMTVARMRGEARAPAPKRKIAVLGAGIAGCAAAYALRQRGHHVTLIDRQDACAKETSGNPVGILYPKLTVGPSPLGRFHVQAFLYARHLAKTLGISSWRECGVAHLDFDGEDAARTKELLSRGNYPEELAAAADGGYLQSIAGMLSPPEFCSKLAEGAGTRYGAAVGSFRKSDDQWEILGVEGKPITAADIVVIAEGYDSKRHAQTEWLPLQSLRGQMTLLRPTPASAKLAQVICHDGYVTPAANGVHAIGATFQKEEPRGADTRPEDDAENLSKLNQHLPELALSSKEIAGSRAGYRATTPDKLPLAGEAPDYEAFRGNFAHLRSGRKAVTEAPPVLDGLYISTGFGAHGLSGAPLAGEIIAAMISGEALPVPEDLLHHLLPERFIFRGLKRKKI